MLELFGRKKLHDWGIHFANLLGGRVVRNLEGKETGRQLTSTDASPSDDSFICDQPLNNIIVAHLSHASQPPRVEKQLTPSN
jgi:hypothetical protein